MYMSHRRTYQQKKNFMPANPVLKFFSNLAIITKHIFEEL